MYLMYIDESGDATSRHFVVAAVVVHEQDTNECGGRLTATLATLGPGWEAHEFHAQHVRVGKGPWRRLPKETREAFTEELADRLNRPFTSGRSAVLFAVVVERAALADADPVERAYEELFLRVDAYLGRLHVAGDSHRSVAISDETRLEARLQQLMDAWRANQGRVRQLVAFVEVPLFADSRASRMLQIADFVAHWAYRSYESGDHAIRDRLLGRFDTHHGIIHGFFHHTRDWRSCACPACSSRHGS